MSNCGSNNFEISPSSSTAVAPISLSDQPAAATGRKKWFSSSTSWIRTLSNPSASETASQTERSIPSVEIVWGSWDETRSSCSSPAWWRVVSTLSCAASSARAAWEARAQATASRSASGRRPSTGSPNDMIPTILPSECSSGTKSSSLGCQASGPSCTGSSAGTNRSPISCDQSKASLGMKYAPARENLGTSSGVQLPQS